MSGLALPLGGGYSVKFHLRDGRTDKETCLLQQVDESQRRRHGVTAAIVVDVVGARACLCSSVRSFVLLLDGV